VTQENRNYLRDDVPFQYIEAPCESLLAPSTDGLEVFVEKIAEDLVLELRSLDQPGLEYWPPIEP